MGPFWGAAEVGDIDTRYLDITAWSFARGGDLPTGPIAVTVAPASGLRVVNPILMAGVSTVGVKTLAHAIMVNLVASAAGTYVVTFSFSTVSGATINRDVSIQVLTP